MAKSFSIKLGADTKDFLNGMSAAQKEINATQKSAIALEKSLDVKFDNKNAVLAQKQFKSALDLTEKKADELRKQLKILEDSGRIDTVDYQTLQTELVKTETQAIKLEQALEKVKNAKVDELSKKFKDVGTSIENAGKKIAPFSALAAGAITGMAKLAKDAVQTGDEIATLADMYDMSTTAIQRWQYVAMQTDMESEQMFKAMQKVQSAFGEQMMGGTNVAVQALNKLGLNYKNFKTNEEAFQATIEAMSNLSSQTEQVGFATDLLGDRFAAALIPLLKSKDAIGDYVKEFEQVGYLSAETVQTLAELDNEVNKVTAQFNQAKTELGVAMIPIYQSLVDILEKNVIPAVKKLAEWFGNLSPETQNAVLGLFGIVAVAAPLLLAFGKISKGIGGLIDMFKNLDKQRLVTMAGFAALAGSIYLVFDILTNKDMKPVEAIFKVLIAGALAGAAAMMAFHASWSVGLAVAGIVAAIAGGMAIINALSKDITGDEVSTPKISAGASIDYEKEAEIMKSTEQSSRLTWGNSTSNSYQSTEDNSSLVVNLYITEPNATAEEIAEAVSRKIATLKQARG